MYKYLFKIFYNTINKKEYDSSILQYNIYHINIIAIKNVIILEKIKKKKELLVIDILDTTALVNMAQVLNFDDFIKNYNWTRDNNDLDAVKTRIYWY